MDISGDGFEETVGCVMILVVAFAIITVISFGVFIYHNLI